MKLTTGLNLLGSRDVEKTLSKKILLANTTEKVIDKKALKSAVGAASDPVYFTNASSGSSMVFNPDIRFRNTFAFSPLTNINYRNDLLVFAENNEIKKAVNILANEIAIMDTETSKYPVYPKINLTFINDDKKDVAGAIQDYLNKIFYPKLWQYYNFKDEGLIEKIREFIITGKLAFEILFDNLKSPKDIVGILPLDPSSLQKVKQGDYVYYIQRAMSDSGKERTMHENQVILIEFNKYDFGYLSYVDRLRMSFNIMRSMQTSKILWFAAKSQVRMHIKLALGDIARTEGIQKLTEAKNQYINHYTFGDDGIVRFNNQPNNSGYREFFTGETASSGHPEIEEVNSNGPDLTEVDSLQFWEKLFWKDTEIPYDRIDPNSQDTWGFADVNSLRKIEVNFAKLINFWRKLLNEIFIKPIVIQLTLKEVEIGIDLELLDSIKMEWIAFNQYEKLAELEVLAKKVELATSISAFGEQENADGVTIKQIPLLWIVENLMDFSKEQLDTMDYARKKENVKLGFGADIAVGETSEEDEEEISEETSEEDEEETSEETSEEDEEETSEDIANHDDENF